MLILFTLTSPLKLKMVARKPTRVCTQDHESNREIPLLCRDQQFSPMNELVIDSKYHEQGIVAQNDNKF